MDHAAETNSLERDVFNSRLRQARLAHSAIRAGQGPAASPDLEAAYENQGCMFEVSIGWVIRAAVGYER